VNRNGPLRHTHNKKMRPVPGLIPDKMAIRGNF
jgi:hypothetical protein